MEIEKTLLLIFGSIAGIGVLAGGFGYLMSVVKKGSRQKDAELMTNAEQIANFYKEQTDQYKIIVSEKEAQWAVKEGEWNKRFTDLSREVGLIKGQLVEKEKQAKEYLDILQNRDPETKKFYELVISAIDNQNKVNAEITRVLKEIHTMTTLEHERDLKVIATVSKQ